jgi:hypothetical protein
MKTTRSKTAADALSTSSRPNNSGKPGHKTPPRSKSRASTAAQSQSRQIIGPSGNPGETGIDFYQLGASSQTCARLTSLDPAKIEQMIQDLSDLREELAPQVPSSVPPGKRLFVTPEPIWKVSAEVREDGRVLLIRHPGLGWLGFIIPQADCDRLAEKLTGVLR